jgi:riboflavin synthase
MFSGIITATQKAETISKTQNGLEATLPIPDGWKLGMGESINIDGVCSTVKSLDSKQFGVYWMAETLSKTNLGSVSPDHTFNLERCITLQDLISGHLVYGHVDCTATVQSVISDGESKTILFSLPTEFTKYIIYKGSIAVNGVSLTVVSVDQSSFSVSLIPHTLSHTNLGDLQKGDTVNIEVDMMAKYLEKLMGK